MTYVLTDICDFGMSEDVHYVDYFRQSGEALLPVRWMAPEAIRDGVFTTKTDVWSMGVVIWEAFEFGAMPYPGMSNGEVVKEVVKGYQMQKPGECGQGVWKVARDCW